MRSDLWSWLCFDMRRFRYLADPLCVGCCTAYFINRWVFKAHSHSAFLHGYFNDLLLIPCALPPLLWLHRRMGLRKHDNIPQVGEVLFHLAIWSILFELIGPHVMRRATGDLLDVVAYSVGALLAVACWNWRERFAAAWRDSS